MDIEWKLLPDIQDFGSDEFWYDLTEGGYIRPKEILADPKQIKMLEDAIAIVRSFQTVIDELCEER